MGRVITIVVFALTLQHSYARDTGSTLVCSAIENGQRHIVSYLETDVDKRVNYIETATRAMWDSHMWSEDSVLVRSYMQHGDEAEAAITLFIVIDRESLAAVLSRPSERNSETRLQCAGWKPQSRNK